MERQTRKRIGAWVLLGMGLVFAARAAFARPILMEEEEMDLRLVLEPQGEGYLSAGKRFLLPPDNVIDLAEGEETQDRNEGETKPSPAAVARAASGGAVHKPPLAPRAPKPPARLETARMAWPVAGRLTSRFGLRRHPILRSVRYHMGIDIAAPQGTQVRAAAAGRVTMAGWSGGYGYLVEIEHAGGVRTRYGHNSKISVREGQEVRKGEVIARVGSTGRSTGPHLHFEVRARSRAVNPMRYLP